MSNTGKQSPLGVNSLSALLNNQGFNINPVASSYMGQSSSLPSYIPGTIVNNTCLRLLTYAIREAYSGNSSGMPNATTYNQLISIGSNTIPALGNAKAVEYTYEGDTTGPYGTSAGWGGTKYTYGNEATSYGFVRLFALQAYNDFNYNESLPQYRDFIQSFQSCDSFVGSSNSTINTLHNSTDFLDGTYSNMNDLITADVAGVNLATVPFGLDFITLGRAVDLSTISTFGLPSNLLKILKNNNAITKSVSLALLSNTLSTTEIEDILSGSIVPTKLQELKIYQAFSIIVGQDLKDVLVTLSCKTVGLETLDDLLNPIKLFPNSYQSLTVPVYNVEQTPNNSKTYYLIYDNGGVNPQLTSSSVVNSIGSIVPAGAPSAAAEEEPSSFNAPAYVATTTSPWDPTYNEEAPKSVPKTFSTPISDSDPAIIKYLALSADEKKQVAKKYSTYMYGQAYTDARQGTVSINPGEMEFYEFVKYIWNGSL